MRATIVTLPHCNHSTHHQLYFTLFLADMACMHACHDALLRQSHAALGKTTLMQGPSLGTFNSSFCTEHVDMQPYGAVSVTLFMLYHDMSLRDSLLSRLHLRWLQALTSMGSMLTELTSSKDADLAQQQHLISGLQAHLRVFCQDVLHHMQVCNSGHMLHRRHVPAALDTSLFGTLCC